MTERRKLITSFTTGNERAPYHVPTPETLLETMQRDLEAWMVAKAAIAKAMAS
jgi:hypothetical protein